MTLSDKLPTLLNDAQLAAVTAPAGPLLVVAGAGTGKTRVITYRVAYVIESGIPAYKVLAVTFTNKAAREMKTRIGREVACPDAWVSTFHSFAARVLRREGHRLGFTPDFSIFDEDDTKATLRAILASVKQETELENLTPDALRQAIGRLKNDCIGPDDMQQADAQSKIICQVYRAYNEALRSQNAMDFDDLLLNLLRLLEHDPDVRDHYTRRFDAVLVDEYQDTNYAQARIVDILCEKHRNLTVTGDPDQSIYSWRGARLKNILDFQKRYPDARIVRLEDNYRSTTEIISAADTLVKHNIGRLERSLRGVSGRGKPVTVVAANDEMAEARWVIEHAKEEVLRGSATYNDFVVLYRTNYQSRAFETLCLDYEVPYVVVGGVAFFERQEVRDVIAYLRLVTNPLDEAALRRAIARPSRGIGEKTIDTVVAAARQQNVDLLAAFSLLGESRRLGRQTHAAGAFLEAIARLRSMPQSPVLPIIKAVVEEAGFRDYWHAKGEEERIENIDELLNAAGQYDDDNPGSNLRGFLDMVTLVTDQDRMTDDDTKGRLALMTIHAAKGLEFPVVFLAGLVEGSLPHAKSMKEEAGPDAIEEERRLCYVGMTRARRELYMTSFSSRRVGAGLIHVAPSRFLDEIPKHGVIWEDARSGLFSSAPKRASWDDLGSRDWDGEADSRTMARERARSPRTAYADRRARDTQREAIERVYEAVYAGEGGFKPGDKVRHNVFGDGVVEKMSGDHVTVNFPGVGRKRLSVTFARLEKIG